VDADIDANFCPLRKVLYRNSNHAKSCLFDSEAMSAKEDIGLQNSKNTFFTIWHYIFTCFLKSHIPMLHLFPGNQQTLVKVFFDESSE